jgi:hypothetical protein
MAEGCCCIAEKLCLNLKNTVVIVLANVVLGLMAGFLLQNNDVLWPTDAVL